MSSSVLSAPMASIGVPTEIKADELRVALTPDGVRELVTQGLAVKVQTGAGTGAGIGDAAFSKAGAKIVDREEVKPRYLSLQVSAFCGQTLPLLLLAIVLQQTNRAWQ